MRSASIRAFLESNPYKYYGKVPRDIEKLLLEDALQTDVFYGLCDGRFRPPTQKEFVNNYLWLNRAGVKQKGVDPKDVGKRIARAWASFIMELDCFCQLRDSGWVDRATIDTKLDTGRGYDLELVYKGELYHLHLYYQTPQADRWNVIKGERKIFGTEIMGYSTAFGFPLGDESADFVGGVHLYSVQKLSELREWLERW